MSNISVQTKGFVEVSRKLKTGVGDKVSRVVFLVGNYMETTAKKNINQSVYQSPKSSWYSRTRKAQQSIAMQKLGDYKAKVFVGVNYGKYLEGGTGIYAGHKPFWTTFGGQIKKPILYKGMKARPYWKPALLTTQKEVPNILNKEFSKL